MINPVSQAWLDRTMSRSGNYTGFHHCSKKQMCIFAQEPCLPAVVFQLQLPEDLSKRITTQIRCIVGGRRQVSLNESNQKKLHGWSHENPIHLAILLSVIYLKLQFKLIASPLYGFLSFYHSCISAHTLTQYGHTDSLVSQLKMLKDTEKKLVTSCCA